MHQGDVTDPNNCGLKWVWGDMEIEILNGSRNIVYVTLDDPYSYSAVGIGGWTVYHITQKTTIVTLSYYTKDRDLQTICMKTNGSCTTSMAKMVRSICYTNDRELKDMCITRRKTTTSPQH
jgi:hypothetical protein